MEFALLYDKSSSRLTFPYNFKFERFDIDAWDESKCRTELRFGKQDLDLLRRNLQIPDEIVCSQRSLCDRMEAMCTLLKSIECVFIKNHWINVLIVTSIVQNCYRRIKGHVHITKGKCTRLKFNNCHLRNF